MRFASLIIHGHLFLSYLVFPCEFLDNSNRIRYAEKMNKAVVVVVELGGLCYMLKLWFFVYLKAIHLKAIHLKAFYLKAFDRTSQRNMMPHFRL